MASRLKGLLKQTKAAREATGGDDAAPTAASNANDGGAAGGAASGGQQSLPVALDAACLLYTSPSPRDRG